MKRLKKKKYVMCLLLLVMVFLYGCGALTEEGTSAKSNQEAQAEKQKTVGDLRVHYINVGESDSVLIESNGHFMLIDAGDIGDREAVTQYLKQQKVKKLNYVIATHPHADHIGGMEDVVEEYKIDKFLMPAKSHTTRTYENLLLAIKKKGLKITKPVAGTQYKLGDAAFTILAPNHYSYGDNINNYSIAIKLVNGKNSFVFIGDNETEAIEDIVNNGIDLTADVYMCGHHGSKTSTNEDILNAIKPKYAVISVGENSYGHPSAETLSLLKKKKLTIYRTDQSGTITASSDGKKITFDCKSASLTSDDQKSGNKPDLGKVKTTYVYKTKTGTKYHQSGCSSLKSSKIKITMKEAQKEGLESCKVCN